MSHREKKNDCAIGNVIRLFSGILMNNYVELKIYILCVEQKTGLTQAVNSLISFSLKLYIALIVCGSIGHLRK